MNKRMLRVAGVAMLMGIGGVLSGCAEETEETYETPGVHQSAVASSALTSEKIWVGTGDAFHVDRSNAILRFDAAGAIGTTGTTCSAVTSPTMALEADGNAASFTDAAGRQIIFPHGLARGPGDKLFVAGVYATHDVATRLHPTTMAPIGLGSICNPGNESSCMFTDYDIGSIATLANASTVTVGPQAATRDIYGAGAAPDRPGIDQPHAIFYDATHDDLYVASSGLRSDGTTGRDVRVFKSADNGNVWPSRTIPMATGDIPISVHYDATNDWLFVGFFPYPVGYGVPSVQVWENASALCAGGCSTPVFPDHILHFTEVMSSGGPFIHNVVHDAANQQLWISDHIGFARRYAVGTELTNPSSLTGAGSSPLCTQYTTASYTGSTWTCQGPASVNLDVRPVFATGSYPYAVAGLALKGDRLYASIGSGDPQGGQAIVVYDNASTLTSSSSPTRVICYNTPGTTTSNYPPQPLVVESTP